jgi:pimeloyl-ACP methyl ester carboxylesterase
LYFAVVFAVGFALGTVRVLWIAPRIGARAAELAEMPLMLAITVAAALWTVRSLAVPPSTGPRLAMGAIALALMLAAELALLPLLAGTVTTEVDPLTSSLFFAALALLAVLPLFAPPPARLRHRLLVAFLTVGSVIPAGIVIQSYRHDLSVERMRVAVGGRVAQTACGPIEYATAGEGPAVLVVHGAGGGYDQGIEFAEPLAAQGFRVVAMSRFGYLGTPLPQGATLHSQADAHACLLDALGIERAAVIGVSAGAPSAALFALRHPRRASALALVVPGTYLPRPEEQPRARSTATRFMLEWAVRSDLLYWFACKVSPSTVLTTVLGTPPAVVAGADAAEQARAAQLMRHVLPLSARAAGLMNEGPMIAALAEEPLEKITTPTLVISAVDDLYGTYAAGRYTAGRIPGARFVGYPTGGHLLVGHSGEALTEIKSFFAGRATMTGKS